MNEKPTSAHAAADTAGAGSTRPPAPPADFYKHCLDKALEAERTADLPAAIDWLRQAQFIGTTVLKREDLPEIATVYAKLLVSTCRSARRLAVHSGNILDTHQHMAAHIKVFSSRLTALLAEKDADLGGRAAVIEGFATRVSTMVTEFRSKQRYDTPAELLDMVLADLAAIVTNVALLGFKVDAPHGTSEELLELASTAVANARAHITWFFPQTFSNWKKSRFMCRQAMRLLAEHVKLEGSAAGSSPELDRLYDQLTAAETALGRQNYWESNTLLKAAEQALATPIATK